MKDNYKDLPKASSKIIIASALSGLFLYASRVKAEDQVDPISKGIVFVSPVHTRYPEDYLMGALMLATVLIGGLIILFALLKLSVALAAKFRKNGRLQKSLNRIAGVVGKVVLVMIVTAFLGYVIMQIFERQPRPENRTKSIWLFEGWAPWY